MRQLLKSGIISLVLIFQFIRPAGACDLCSVYSASAAQGFTARGFSLGLSEQFTHFGTLKQDGHDVTNTLGQSLDSSITQLFVSYQFLHRLGAQLTLPYIVRSYTRSDGLGGTESDSFSGIGDISLTAKLLAYEKNSEDFTLNVSFMGGVKFPTGSASRLNEELNEEEEEDESSIVASGIHGHDLVLGSGSYDALFGGSLYTRWKRFFVTTDLQYSVRTRGAVDYKFANDLHWSVSPGCFILMTHANTLTLQARFSGEYKGLDNLDGASADDTGITSVYFGPDLSYTWRSKLAANFGIDVPVVLSNTALQSVPDYRLRSSINWHF